MADPRIKTLRIKTGVVKRLAKEKLSYEKEATQELQRMERMKNEGKDEYDIKKQHEVYQESLMMVPDCQRRLVTAVEDLQKILDSEVDMKEMEVYKEAEAALSIARHELPA